MKAKRTLLPGQPGTKKLVRKYGKRLIYVRYRYDAAAEKRLTTVELIVEETAWVRNRKRVPPNKIVNLRVHYTETQLRRLIKAAGGKWHAEKRVWRLPYGEAKQLGLTHRIIKTESAPV